MQWVHLVGAALAMELFYDDSRNSDGMVRLSGQNIQLSADTIHPHPQDAAVLFSHRLPRTENNRFPVNLANKPYSIHSKEPLRSSSKHNVIFFDLEDCLYLSHDVKLDKVLFFKKFLEEKMKMTDQKEIQEFITSKRKALIELMKQKNVKFEDPYSFLKPNDEVTGIISSINARRWIFTNSPLYRTFMCPSNHW